MNGQLPSCEADQLLTLVPIQPPTSTSGHSPSPSPSSSSSFTAPSGKVKGHPATPPSGDAEEDYALELAMAMSASMADSSPSSAHHQHRQPPTQSPGAGRWGTLSATVYTIQRFFLCTESPDREVLLIS